MPTIPTVARYWLLASRLPNGDPRRTRFVGIAAVRLPGGICTTADIVKIGDTACLEVETVAWNSHSARVKVEWSKADLCVLLRLIERQHVLATARRHAASEGRN